MSQWYRAYNDRIRIMGHGFSGKDISFTVLQMFIDAPYELFIGWAASILSWICIRLSSLVQTHTITCTSIPQHTSRLCVSQPLEYHHSYINKTWIMCYARQYYLLHTSVEVQDLKWLAAALCGCMIFFELWSGTIAHQWEFFWPLLKTQVSA